MATNVLKLLLLSSVMCAITEASVIQSKHLNTRHKESVNLNQRDDKAIYYPVLGIKGQGANTIHPRLEIRELEKNTDQFNVFLLGLQRFQNMSQDDKLSYFRVAGMFSVKPVSILT